MSISYTEILKSSTPDFKVFVGRFWAFHVSWERVCSICAAAVARGFQSSILPSLYKSMYLKGNPRQGTL